MRLAMNNRICAILATTTGIRLPAVSEVWWQWWNDTNEVYVEGEKPMTTAYYRQEMTVVKRRRRFAKALPRAAAATTTKHKDCLVAGTPVWTERGPVAIDKIRVGDLLLSQDVKTGELAFKPVLKTTTRRPGSWCKIESGQAACNAAAVTVFGSLGKGWVKARACRRQSVAWRGWGPDDRSAGTGPRLATFNVVVADFHTYFVGPGKLLSHDNTMVDPAQDLCRG